MIEITSSYPSIPEAAHTIAGWTINSASAGEAVLPQTPETIAHQISLGLSLIAIAHTRHLAGHITTYPLTQEQDYWWEVGTLIAPPEWRHLGVGAKLCAEVAGLHPADFLVATTKNPVAAALFVQAGFHLSSFASIPQSARVGLCEQAPCYTPANGSRPISCRREHNCGGQCVALVRPPLPV